MGKKKGKCRLNPVPHMPVLGFTYSAASKGMMS